MLIKLNSLTYPRRDEIISAVNAVVGREDRIFVTYSVLSFSDDTEPIFVGDYEECVEYAHSKKISGASVTEYCDEPLADEYQIIRYSMVDDVNGNELDVPAAPIEPDKEYDDAEEIMRASSYEVRRLNDTTLLYSNTYSSDNAVDAFNKLDELVASSDIGDYVSITEIFDGAPAIISTYRILDGEIEEYQEEANTSECCGHPSRYWTWEEWHKSAKADA